MITDQRLLVVIHETVVDCDTLLEYLQSPSFGASYHACIDRQGGIVYLVPSYEKAFAASNSEFTDPYTGEVEQLNGSVDDFAYHIALESPTAGSKGYTAAQYKSLAWLISKTGVEDERIVTHKEVSLSGSDDPRDYDKDKVFEYLFLYKRERVLEFGVLN